ncbi:hypothetical protein SAMN05192539_103144 [Paraburkholderia diazotrophica]|uniref:Uncharacterized protein n=1 Tax=Paraburkholderia diazotrophica TaxID=667676 RepID=A0A1H7DSH8_9BURK|nr:hypothetical protein SAMN05192539_103144 [Paraburkholderia diazotrophica]
MASTLLIYAFSQTSLEWFFLFGCVTAVLVRIEWLRQVARHGLASWLAITCMGAALPIAWNLRDATSRSIAERKNEILRTSKFAVVSEKASRISVGTAG